MTGTFKEGLPLVPGIEKKLEEDAIFIDNHRILVLNYKMAILYFAAAIMLPALTTCKKSSMTAPICVTTCSAMPGWSTCWLIMKLVIQILLNHWRDQLIALWPKWIT
ncbi:MAG: hypothetical protein WDO71_23305 [Bacteroidota bacterium]